MIRTLPGTPAEAPCEPWHVVSVSGGKDSLACWLVALETQPRERVEATFADTGHEHPITYEYLEDLERRIGPIRRLRADFGGEFATRRDYIREHWVAEGVPPRHVESALEVLHPTGNPFLDLCLLKGRFPSRTARFCTERLKVEPLVTHQIERQAEHGWVWSWQGVRSAESRARRYLPEWQDLGGGIGVYRPILRWSAQDVFEAGRARGIPPNPLYLQGMGRVGCMPCIHAGKDELLEIGRRFPDQVDRVREWERLVSMASKRGYSTLFHRWTHGTDKPRAQVWDEERIDRHLEWARTARGGRQYDLLRDLEPTRECASRYGLCEG